MCIQETKIANYDEVTLATGHKLVLLQQKTAKHHGLGFVISPRLIPHIRSWWYISDRVAAIEVSIPSSRGKPTLCQIVNAYGPTLQKASEDPSLLDGFYPDLSNAVTTPSRFQVYVCGDFNSKLGTLTLEDEEIGLSCYMGVHGKGKRNSNGDALLQFLIQHGLFACNTAFEHPSQHKTTWTGWIPHPSSPTASLPVYNQIDYILCKQTSTCLF